MALIFHEGFETEDWRDNWDVAGSEGLQWLTSEKKHEGTFSLFFDTGGHAHKIYDPPLTNAYISYWFYDELKSQALPDEATLRVWAGEHNDFEKAFLIGIATQGHLTHYCYWNTGVNWIDTGINRTVGWHHIEIWVYDGKLTAAIDNNVVCRDYQPVDQIKRFSYLTSPGVVVWWIDDVNVYSPPPHYPGQIPPTPPQPGEMPVGLLVSAGALGLLGLLSL